LMPVLFHFAILEDSAGLSTSLAESNGVVMGKSKPRRPSRGSAAWELFD